MQADMVFRPFLLSDRVKELDGKRVAIKGYIHPGATGKHRCGKGIENPYIANGVGRDG